MINPYDNSYFHYLTYCTNYLLAHAISVKMDLNAFRNTTFFVIMIIKIQIFPLNGKYKEIDIK